VTEGEDVTMEAGPALLALAASTAAHGEQIELLDSGVAGLEAAMQTLVQEGTYDAAVASLQGAIALKADQSALGLLGTQVTAIDLALQSKVEDAVFEDGRSAGGAARGAPSRAQLHGPGPRRAHRGGGRQAVSAPRGRCGGRPPTPDLLVRGPGRARRERHIRTLKVSAPIVATQGSQHVHLSLDGSLAEQSALDEVPAQAASTQGALTSTNQALAVLAVEVDGK
jgi:hypothetical protein